MYKRADRSRPAPRHLWHVGAGNAFFGGQLGRNALHAHSVPVLLVGLYDDFRLRLDRGTWLSCRSAVVPPGLSYEFDLDNQPLGVFYLEPSVGAADMLRPLVHTTREVQGALVGAGGDIDFFRNLYETGTGKAGPASDGIEVALQDLVAYLQKRGGRHIDARVARVCAYLSAHCGEAMPIQSLAAAVGLSTFRLQHLFARDVGVPIRRYRTWQRLRAAIRDISRHDATFTDAAHGAGFYDQAHFSRAFRRSFGAPASQGLRRRGALTFRARATTSLPPR